MADLLLLVGVVAGIVGLVLGVTAQVRLRRLRRDYAVLLSPPGGAGEGRQTDLVSLVGAQLQHVRRLGAEVEQLRADVETARVDVGSALRHVALVRYDAFPDMGGRLSFSLALVDDAGDGVVLTTITGRHDSRSYAKGLRGGRSDQPLSPEEQHVVDYATDVVGR